MLISREGEYFIITNSFLDNAARTMVTSKELYMFCIYFKDGKNSNIQSLNYFMGADNPLVRNVFRTIEGEVFLRVLDFVELHLYFSCNGCGSIDGHTN